MRVEELSYDLPTESIAQSPLPDREASRLFRLAHAGPPEHLTIADLPACVPDGALVVLNDTRVIPARLIGRKEKTFGKVEIFLVRHVGERDLGPGTVSVWRAMGRASKGLRDGTVVDAGPLVIRVLRVAEDGLLEVGLSTRDGTSVKDAIRMTGHVPLPPYIKRMDDAADVDRYQTVFARADGAVAAPTAGLHLTRALLGRLEAKRCEIATITLHVGLGTFAPVTAVDLDTHRMHAEEFEVPESCASAIDRARDRGAPVLAVGTTVVRALESAADPERVGRVRPRAGETRLLIQPGYAFKVTDLLLTNFHLPRSTLLALVCAFAGKARVLSAYRDALGAGYRFFSYGDAMLTERAPVGSAS